MAATKGRHIYIYRNGFFCVWFYIFLGCYGVPNYVINKHIFPWDKMRLPSNVLPNHYDLSIHPSLTTLHFTGSVKIEVDIKQDTSYIVLHSKDLNVTLAKIVLEDDPKDGIAEQTLTVLEHLQHEQIALLAHEILRGGKKYQLHIQFHAQLADGFDGFYKSSYRTQNGEKRILAATDFEPTAARMAFPCFDEPQLKATFTVRIKREESYNALSNMPKIRTLELGNGLVEDHFAQSVRMSTYLVAYVVCDFRSVTANTSSGVKVSVYAVPEKWDQTHHALEVAVKLLEFYESYFGISYPLPKQGKNVKRSKTRLKILQFFYNYFKWQTVTCEFCLIDLIAIPDFQSGAMENWGLITYRETALLYDPQTSSAQDKMEITRIIGHELAHQWFGNLVTMDWWNDIWLNEGFARYMEKVSLSTTYPDIPVDDYFLNVCFGAISRDCLNSSHPISNPAETPVQIMEMFDTVSYDKGACILNMLRDFLSEEVFRSGITRYLKLYSYQNAKSNDLWNSIANTSFADTFPTTEFCYTSSQAERTAHRYTCSQTPDIRSMMDTWTKQMGIPLITVERKGQLVQIRQDRFLKGVLEDDAEYPALQSGYLWHIPLTYVTSGSQRVWRHLLKTKTDTVRLQGEVSWIKFNVDMNGYYMVHYGDRGWDELIYLLEHDYSALSSKDRTNLIHNALQLVSAGKLSLDRALDLTRYLRKETDNMPLLQGIAYLNVLHWMMEKMGILETAGKLKNYILWYFKDVIDKQTWSDDGSLSERKVRAELLELACSLEYPQCVERASKIFSEWVSSNGAKSVPTVVLRPVYLVGAQQTSNWNFLLQVYSQTLSSAEKKKILFALTCSKDLEKLNKLIDLAMEGEAIKTQDLPTLIVAIARNPAGHMLAWNFVQKNWKKLLEKFHLGSSSIRKILTGTMSSFASEKELEQAKALFDLLKSQGHELKVTEVILETIQKNIRWAERNLHVLDEWLEKNSPQRSTVF
ncbi:endoplasmic reticulum aminopeptidase 2-like isoform X1 [Paramormyrops kingsleyae]|uniref:endoplasmic reticulum aminopeptidase 2-like isoform X1 n=1 Tax=Paramormyrops kingsleyae TaxID=1676925 RepID=UPI003B979998